MEQATLVLNTSKGNPRLKDLYMRPIIGARRFQVRTECEFYACVGFPPR